MTDDSPLTPILLFPSSLVTPLPGLKAAFYRFLGRLLRRPALYERGVMREILAVGDSLDFTDPGWRWFGGYGRFTK